jgi:thiol-disulfide isomerase/thioredoxin
MIRALLVCVCMSSMACSDRAAKTDQAPTQTVATTPTAPGSDLVGTPAPAWITSEWTTESPLSLADLRGRVVVVRFWTNTCPYCERSMPALQKLSAKYANQPVTFVGLYHSKPRGTEREWSTVLATLEEWGVTFPIGYDREWKTVQSWWLDGRGPRATSASFVIGADGTYAHVHPGPVYFPGDGGDFAALEAAIDRELAEITKG